MRHDEAAFLTPVSTSGCFLVLMMAKHFTNWYCSSLPENGHYWSFEIQSWKNNNITHKRNKRHASQSLDTADEMQQSELGREQFNIYARHMMQRSMTTYAVYWQGGILQRLIISISTVIPVGLRLWTLTKLTRAASDPPLQTSSQADHVQREKVAWQWSPAPRFCAVTTYTTTHYVSLSSS